MEEVGDYQKALLICDSVCFSGSLGDERVLGVSKVNPIPGNHQLQIQATDVVNGIWQLTWGMEDFLAHQTKLGISPQHNTWGVYFELLKTAITEKPIKAVLEGTTLKLLVEYPISGAVLKGNLTLESQADPSRKNVAKLVFEAIESLQSKGEQKRVRPRSPSPVAVQPVKQSKTKPVRSKKKKPNQIGSKLL